MFRKNLCASTLRPNIVRPNINRPRMIRYKSPGCRWNSRHLATQAALLVALCAAALVCRPASGQIRNEAVLGEPFGVGRVTVSLDRVDLDVALLNAFRISDREGRIFYPTFSSAILSGVLDEVIQTDEPRLARSLTVHFLFTGSEPLDVTVSTARDHQIRLRPEPVRPAAERRIWRNWWRDYHRAAQNQSDVGDYPPIVETYLISMLGSRLGLDPPLLGRASDDEPSELTQTLELLFGVESYRLDVMRQTMLGRESFDEPIVHEFPAAPPRLRRDIEIIDDTIEMESIAEHVPAECFYVRFGTWENQLWLTRILEEHGGDLSRMVSLRGQDNRATAKLLEQIVLEQTSVTEILGGQLISDVAFIGRDTFVNEGAAIGIILEARNGLLGGALTQQRRMALAALEDLGVTVETVEIAGKEVSFMSSPDNRIRSFYAVDGDYHLTTNCREIVQRFFEAGDGHGALADTDEFRNARIRFPLEREDTIFAYFSSEFMRGLTSPQYQIELARRIRSTTDLEIVQLAKLAAIAEGIPHNQLDELVLAGLLPPGFGRRPDGSGPIIEATRVLDSKRGVRGYFLPIPDVEIEGLTQSEFEYLRRRESYFRENWSQLDPLMVGIKRINLGGGHERLQIDAQISPFGESNYGWLFSLLGDPLDYRMTTTADDVIHFQASLRGGSLLPRVPPHVLFGAVQDDRSPETDLQPTGFFKTLQILTSTPGYLGAWPKPGYLDILPFVGGIPDAHGFTKSLLGFWRWQGNGYSLLSFDRAKLTEVSGSLDSVASNEPAHIRLYVGDLTNSGLSRWANALAFSRARQTSIGNTRMLHSMTQQLRIPADQAKSIAEGILNVDLMCPLGGDYALIEQGMHRGLWVSNALGNPVGTELPEGFQSPFLTWFRGLDASLLKTPSQVELHIDLDVER